MRSFELNDGSDGYLSRIQKLNDEYTEYIEDNQERIPPQLRRLLWCDLIEDKELENQSKVDLHDAEIQSFNFIKDGDQLNIIIQPNTELGGVGYEPAIALIYSGDVQITKTPLEYTDRRRGDEFEIKWHEIDIEGESRLVTRFLVKSGSEWEIISDNFDLRVMDD